MPAALDEPMAPNLLRARLAPRLVGLAVPVAAVVAALAVGAIMLLALGANPIEGYVALADGAFGAGNALADTALKGMPLLLVGVGICIAFRTGVANPCLPKHRSMKDTSPSMRGSFSSPIVTVIYFLFLPF